jgi:hypothetical protein
MLEEPSRKPLYAPWCSTWIEIRAHQSFKPRVPSGPHCRRVCQALYYRVKDCGGTYQFGVAGEDHVLNQAVQDIGQRVACAPSNLESQTLAHCGNQIRYKPPYDQYKGPACGSMECVVTHRGAATRSGARRRQCARPPVTYKRDRLSVWDLMRHRHSENRASSCPRLMANHNSG